MNIWHILAGFRLANLKLRKGLGDFYLPLLYYHVLNTESERITRKYLFDKK